MNTTKQPKIDHIDILFEDEYMLIVNKPNNFLVHESHYARNIKEPTLLEVLNDQLGYSVYPAHRLDRKTSGVLLFVKDKMDMERYQSLFVAQQIQKTYYAVVRGFTKDKGKVDTPVQNDDTGIYKDALTYYETIRTIVLDIPVKPYPQSRYSLVKLLPKTGRMHQLRKHMNKISHPIVGDYKYGDRFHNRNFEDNFGWDYMFLHAYSLDFIHPITEKALEIKAPFPPDWQDLFEKFGWSL